MHLVEENNIYNTNACLIKTRNLCAFCRFQKCLSVGMDPQRVMKGEDLQEKKKNR